MTKTNKSLQRPCSKRLIIVTTYLLGLCLPASLFGQISTFSVLYTFTGTQDGGAPESPLIRDSEGNLYSTNINGGDPSCQMPYGCGVAFKLSPARAESSLFTFSEATGQSFGGLKQDSEGNLYGTTIGGEVYPGGTVFKLSPSGMETVLFSFTPAPTPTGSYPDAGLFGDPQGNLYGTTLLGGSTPSSDGVIFRLEPNGKYTVFHSFGNTPGDGKSPQAPLIRDMAGNLYGTTALGGSSNAGTVFRVDPSGKLTILHSFSGVDGETPYGGSLTLDSAGNLYGTTESGGVAGEGVVFEFSASGNYTVLYSFQTGADAQIPSGTLALAPSAGYLFGTAAFGGAYQKGAVFAIKISTGEEHVLYSFKGQEDGTRPYSGLLGVPGENGTFELFGTASAGGLAGGCFGRGCGTVFKISVGPANGSAF